MSYGLVLNTQDHKKLVLILTKEVNPGGIKG